MPKSLRYLNGIVNTGFSYRLWGEWVWLMRQDGHAGAALNKLLELEQRRQSIEGHLFLAVLQAECHATLGNWAAADAALAPHLNNPPRK